MKIKLEKIKEYLDQGHSIEEAQKKYELTDEIVEQLLFSIIEEANELAEAKKKAKKEEEDPEDEEDEEEELAETTLSEKAFDKMSDKELKDWLTKNDTEEQVSPAYGHKIKAAKQEAKKRKLDLKEEEIQESLSIKAVETMFEKEILPDLGRSATTNQKKEAWTEFVETLKQAGTIDSRVARATLPKRFEEVDIETLQNKLSEMNQEQLTAIAELINDPIMASIKKIQKDVTSVSEETETTDLNTLINENEAFSEEFKEKASVLFEAAVSEKVETKLEEVKNEIETRITEEVTNNFNHVVDKVDKYLTYAVESWINDNDEQVTSLLRTEIAESFIENLKTIFEKHYIEIPETKRDLFEELSEQAASLEEKYEEKEKALLETTQTLNSLQREKIIKDSAEGLYDTQADKLKKLTENVDFKDAEDFERKVKLIKKTYFSQYNNGLNEEIEDDNVEVRRHLIEEKEENDMSNSVMGKYVSAISRHAKM